MDSHILSTKYNSLFVIFIFEILTTNDVVNFDQLGPVDQAFFSSLQAFVEDLCL